MQSLVKDINLYCCCSVGKLWSTLQDRENCSIQAPLSTVSQFSSVQVNSVIQSCLTPMDCNMPGLPIHHQLPQLVQTHVHRVIDAIQPSHPLSSPSPPDFNLSQQQDLSSESALHIRWPNYWSFSFSISPSTAYSELISFRIDWFDLLAVQGTLKSLQHHS